jgi:hypothetical protein
MASETAEIEYVTREPAPFRVRFWPPYEWLLASVRWLLPAERDETARERSQRMEIADLRDQITAARHDLKVAESTIAIQGREIELLGKQLATHDARYEAEIRLQAARARRAENRAANQGL